MNNRGRATYLQHCFTNLKSAMSTIFRSDQGLKDLATCDTFVATLGYNTGKAMAGLIDLVRRGYFRKDESILFVHTGGSPALYAYMPHILEEADYRR